MNSAGNLAHSHLLPILFVYGLSFFCFGLVVLIRDNSQSALDLRRFISLLAAFGLLHGISEWADMFLSLGTNYWTPRGSAFIELAGLFLALSSFVLLLDFGVRFAWLRKSSEPRIRLVARMASGAFVLVIIVWGVLAADKHAWELNSSILMRYALAIPATVLTAVGFYRQSSFADVARFDNERGTVQKAMLAMAVCMATYGFLAGVIVPKAPYFPASILNYDTFMQVTGFPVQLFRSLCAFCAAFLVAPIMSLFTRESTYTLEVAVAAATEARDGLENKVRERTLELARANEDLRAEVAERIRLETESKLARRAADEANAAKSEFLANMSHEIRTPLNGVIGMVDLCLNTNLTLEQRNDLEIARSSANSLLVVINDILDFSKIEARKLHLDLTEFNLRSAIEGAVSNLGLQAEKQNIELACHIDAGVPEDLIGDLGRLRQIVLNLVGNAIKFTAIGEVVVSVRAESVNQMEAVLHFSVADTGVGIAKEKHKSIFEPFRQVDNSTTRTYGGTGLGLAISSQLVQLMGGKICLESEPARGSTFHFIAKFGVPLSAVVRPALRSLIDLEGLPVLVVDDNSTNRRILHEMLAHWHMNPADSENGAAALERLQTAKHTGQSFPLVIVDRNMPGMDGFAVVERIRVDPALAGASIMMLSSASTESDYQRCRELGVAAYLTKPIRQSALLNAIISAMGPPTHKTEKSQPLTRANVAITPARNLRVLLAEDNSVNQRLALRLLEKHNCVVKVVSNGREALAAVKKSKFDLVLMDLQMPEMDGLTATAAIRMDEQRTGLHLPILAVTAHAMQGDRERCLAAGMDGYISKPILSKELYLEMDRVLSTFEEQQPQDELTFDEASLRQRLENDEVLLRELVELFQASHTNWLRDVRSAIELEDALALETSAHTLKGALATFAANRALGVTVRLETIAREKRLDGALQAYEELEVEMDRLRLALLTLAERAPA